MDRLYVYMLTPFTGILELFSEMLKHDCMTLKQFENVKTSN